MTFTQIDDPISRKDKVITIKIFAGINDLKNLHSKFCLKSILELFIF